jgi:hypothetical protein
LGVGVTGPSGKPAHIETSEGLRQTAEGEMSKPLPLQLELPVATPPVEVNPEALPERAGPQPFGGGRAAAVLFGTLVCLSAAAAVVLWWAVPWYVRRQCIELAAAHDIDLVVDQAKLDWDGVHLSGIVATSPQIPGARAEAVRIDVQTSALRPNKMAVRGAALTVSGPLEKALADLTRWRASPSTGQSEAWPRALWVFEGARVVWQDSSSESIRAEASGVSAELEPLQLHARSDHVTVTVARGMLGPWRVDVDRLPASSRVRVALDPGVPEACTVLAVGDGERTTSVDIVIPWSPLAHLGVPESLLALGGNLQLEANIHYAALGPTRVDASATGGLHGVELPISSRPIDLAWEAAVSGNASAGIDVRKARFAVGPLVGPLTGTFKRFDDGFRVDLAWAAGPVPCEAFSTQLGLGQPFEIGYALRKLAETSQHGLRRGASGQGIRATVLFSFDSRDLGATTVDFAPEGACGG